MRPGHVPYGYRIKDGVGVICEEEAENIRKMFEMYLDGSGLQAIADTLGLDLFHGGVSRIISNGKYLGTDFYPRYFPLLMMIYLIRLQLKRKDEQSD